MLEANPISTCTFVAVDIETTGPRPGSGSIIDIGAVRIEDGRVTGELSTLVRPDGPVPGVIEHLTGISTAMVLEAPDVSDVIRAFAEFARGAVLVAHGHRFDLGFLDYEAERVWGTPFPRPVLDTLTLSRRLHPELPRHNLRDLSTFYDTGAHPNHRALPDAAAAAEVLRRMIPELVERGVTTVGEAARFCGHGGGRQLASKLPLSTNIPDGPGVYCFRDDAGAIVYVGRAKNLRTRIRGHFYALDDSDAAPAARTTSISYITCCSGLDAELLEARLERRYGDTAERTARRPVAPVYIHADTNSAFPSLRVTHSNHGPGTLIGPLANEHSARVLADTLVGHFGLKACRRPVSQCAGRPCSPATAARCGAPDADEIGAAAYRERVSRALAVFNGGGPAFREMLHGRRENALRTGRVAEANDCRDALKALDRTLSMLDLGERACACDVRILIEATEDEAALLVVADGWRFCAVRCTREDVNTDLLTARLVRAVTRARNRVAARRIPATRLRDMIIIDEYCRRHDVVQIEYAEDVEKTAARAIATLRRMMRIPRKRHAGVSDA